MDPRPYHFEYRRPRLSNPTLYVSFHLASPRISTRVSTTSVICLSPATPNPDPLLTNLSRIYVLTQESDEFAGPFKQEVQLDRRSHLQV